MRNKMCRGFLRCLGWLLLAAVVPVVGQSPREQGEARIDPKQLEAAGLRAVSGTHLTLWTDLPSVPAVDELPRVFDQAVSPWCERFQVPESRLLDWRVTGYLMRDSQRFRELGALPADLPPFQHGYSRGRVLWLYEQPSDYYRRHLLLHEGTHAFALTLLDGAGPPWFMEGMAELLGTHTWRDGKLRLHSFPRDREDVPEWGRIRLIKSELAAGRALTLPEIMEFSSQAHQKVEAYAWCWAACAFLESHPRLADAFGDLVGHVQETGPTFSRPLLDRLRDDRHVAMEWQVFVANLDYGYDLERASIMHADAEQPVAGEWCRREVRADRGWQSSGLRVEADTTYEIAAKGRYQLAQDPRVWWCEPGGVTIRYHRGQPLGIVLAAIQADDADDEASGLVTPVAIGARGVITARRGGVLYFRINEPESALGDNLGEVRVAARRKP